MRALLTPDVAPKTGTVILRPGHELIGMFSRGRVLVCTEPDFMKSLPAGLISDAEQPLLDDPALLPFFSAPAVIAAAGGIGNLEWRLARRHICQWPDDEYHHHDFTVLRTAGGAVSLCYTHDNRFRDIYIPEPLEETGRRNAAEWVIDVARCDLALPEGHQLTLPELSWWAAMKNVADHLPEAPARRLLKMPAETVPAGGRREGELRPERAASDIVQEIAHAAGAAKNCRSSEKLQEQQEQPAPAASLISLDVDPESPATFMLRPKPTRWECCKYLQWVKKQACVGCGNAADDPHHLIGHGQGGMATKAHDLFTIPLCRGCHRRLHDDPRKFETEHGSQPELVIKTIGRALALGVIA